MCNIHIVNIMWVQLTPDKINAIEIVTVCLLAFYNRKRMYQIILGPTFYMYAQGIS